MYHSPTLDYRAELQAQTDRIARYGLGMFWAGFGFGMASMGAGTLCAMRWTGML